MKRLRRLLHPSDFSATSERAFAEALALAEASHAALTIVHVLTPIPLMVGDVVAPARIYADLRSAARTRATKALARRVARAKKKGVRASPLLLEGMPAEQIVRAARAKRADMIVIGTHGRTGLRRLLLGSVAERVIGHAPCPVLTVRSR